MTAGLAVAVALLAVAASAWPSPRAVVNDRARRLLPDRPRPAGSRATAFRTRWWLAAAAGLAVCLLVGGLSGLVAGAVVLAGGERLLRNASRGMDAAATGALVGDLPVACDLLGVCLSAGMPVGAALAAVAEAVPAPLGPQLRGVAAHHRLGADARTAWSHAPPELAGLGRVLVRAGESGSAAVPALRVLAAESRAAVRAATEASLRRAGVWILAPLGACFLPAFLCLGVVPLVLGIAGDVFG